ncbi:MAG TPA: hypothetical protein VLZ44_00575 [Treponemataceae bacterium]|nr:hypothetical protein [Treponemataceae bacterium]
MKAKQAVRIFVFGLFFTSLLLVSIIFYLELSGKLRDRSACIVLPNEGGYVESWAPYLTQLARALDVSDLSIKTYTTKADLHEYVRKADRLNILWIEVPLSSDFPITDIIEADLLTPLYNSQKVLESTPTVIQKTFFSLYYSSEYTYTLPFTMNPLVQIYKNSETEDGEKNTLLIPLQKEEDRKNFISFCRTTFYPYLSSMEEENLLSALPSLLAYLHIDKTSINYQKSEIIPYFFKNNKKNVLINASDLASFSVEQRLAVSIASLGKTISSDFSYLIFPQRTSDLHNEKIRSAQDYLLIPEVAFNIASKRNHLPVNVESISKNVFNDFIKKQIRQAENCFVPALEADIENNELFLKSIKILFQ